MRIDLSDLPEDKQDCTEVREFCDRVQKASDTLQIRGACVHEVAHEIYMRRAGATDTERRGMKIGYDASANEYFISVAAVKPIFPMPWNPCLEDVAKYYAAGGTAMRELTTETATGDAKDYEDFCKFCEDFFPQHSANAKAHWDKAVREVEKDLRLPQFRREIWQKANEFEKWLLA